MEDLVTFINKQLGTQMVPTDMVAYHTLSFVVNRDQPLVTLVETAGTFYMLQACMQGNCLKNLENSG